MKREKITVSPDVDVIGALIKPDSEGRQDRLAVGCAKPFPQNFQRDARGLRVAIWA